MTIYLERARAIAWEHWPSSHDFPEREAAERAALVALTEAADEIASLRARVEVLVDLLARYRNETPLGHQPHMIAHVADAAILAARQALKDTPDE